jgi:hypothetical protein
MLAESIKFESFLPPSITFVGGKTFVIPGWTEVPSDTELDDVYKKWTKILPKVSQTDPEYDIHEFVPSSKGDKTYEVIFNNGTWNCECVGFGFRRDCKHVKEVAKRHGYIK